MSVLVECPACESRFELSGVSGEPESGCPACKFAFDASSHVCDKGKPAFEINTQTGLPEIPQPRCLEQFARPISAHIAPPPLAPPKPKPPEIRHDRIKVVAATRPVAADSLNNGAQEWNVNGWDTSSDDSELNRETLPDKSRAELHDNPDDASRMPNLVSVAIGILLCMISVGSLVGIILMLSNSSADKQSIADNTAESAATERDFSGDESQVSTQNPLENDEVAHAELMIADNSSNTLDLAKTANRIKTGNTIYDRIWEKNAGYILQFDMPANLGAQQSMMGLAIDRRGWVLTNLSELDQHPTGKMSQLAAPAWNQPIKFLPLPAAEGLAGALPEFNLCILQFPADALPPTEIVVDEHFDFESDVMLYAIAPAAASVAPPFVKCRIFKRQPQANVPPSVAAQLQSRGFKIGDQFRWILHDGQLESSSSPCPLFSATGELVAIHLLFDEQSKTGYAVPARVLLDLRKGTVGNLDSVADVPAVKNLASLFKRETSVTVAKVPLMSDFETFKKGDFAVIDRAKEQFAICDGAAVDWLAKSAGEYRKLQSFANLLVTMDETVIDTTIDLDRRMIFESDADTLYDKISTVQWPTMRQIEQQNQFAVAGLEVPGQPFFAYVQVERPVGMVNIGTQPVAVCKIIGTEKSIVVPINRTAGEVSIDSQWLVIGRDDPDQKVEAPGLKRAFISLIRARRLIAEPR